MLLFAYLSILSDLASVATIIGAIAIPITIYQYSQAKKDKAENVYADQLAAGERKILEAFNTLANEWRAFLHLCLQHDEIDIATGAYLKPLDKAEAKNRQAILYEIFTSMLESAFQYYQFQPNDQKQKYWRGWEAYLDDWLKTDSFRTHVQYNIQGNYYSDDFTTYLISRIDKIAA